MISFPKRALHTIGKAIVFDEKRVEVRERIKCNTFGPLDIALITCIYSNCKNKYLFRKTFYNGP